MKKRILSLILTLVLILSSVPFTAVPVSAATYNGTCGKSGDNLTWSLDIESGVLTINGEGEMADYKMSSPASWYEHRNIITSVVIEYGVTTIGSYAFYRLTELTSITIGSSLERIKNDAFTFCSSLSEVNIGDIADWYDIQFEDKSANPLDKAKKLYAGGELVTSIVVPDGVTSIGDYAFCGYASLTGITLHEGITEIGSEAFRGCTMLSGIELPNSLQTIGSSAFSMCSSLEFINIPSGVTTIDYNTFYLCENLTEIIIPKSVTTVSGFAFSGCNKLETVYYDGTEADFESISVSSNNEPLLNANIVFDLRSEICGDVNSDGEISVKDVLLLRKSLAGIEEPDPFGRIAADVDGDGELSVKDVLTLRKYLAGIITEFSMN